MPVSCLKSCQSVGLVGVFVVMTAAACAPFRVDLGGKTFDTGDLTGTDLLGDSDLGADCLDPLIIQRTIRFDARDPGCPWSDDDNAWPAAYQMTARIEQSADLDLLVQGQVCDFAISPSGWEDAPSDSSGWWEEGDGWGSASLYDDQMLLVVGGVVVASSSSAPVEYLPRGPHGLPTYDWEALVDRSFDPAAADPWCLDADTTTGCAVPGSSDAGPFQVPLGQTTAVAVAEQLLAEPTVQLVVVGDNDWETDCAHAPLSVDLTLAID